MAGASEANSHSQAQTINLHFNGRPEQTINLTITPALAAGNSLARDSFNIDRIHKIYAFTIPVFIGLLQIQTQGMKTPLFQAHPLITTAGVLCMLGYQLAFLGSLRFSLYSTQLSIVMGVCGSLSLASLVTLLIPHSLCYIRYIFYVSLAVVELHQLFKVFYNRYLRRSFIS